MLNISRLVRVIFSKEAEQEYQKLVSTIKEEKSKNIENSENQQLFKSIEEKIERIKYSPDFGIQIPKKNFAPKYLQQYGINNLWKMNLFNHWRLIYTIRGDRIEILFIVLDLIDHPEYNKIFNYRKR